MRWTIGKRLTIVFVGLLVLIMGLSAYGLVAYSKALDNFSDFTITGTERINALRDMQVELKKEVQASKNILLRGQDPQMLAKYKQEYYSQVDQVKKIIEGLKTGPYRLIREDNKANLRKFEAEFEKLNKAYEESFLTYKGGETADIKAADAPLIGIDLPATDLVDVMVEIARKYVSEQMQVMNEQTDRFATILGGLGLLIFIAGLGFTFFVVRSIVEPLKSLMSGTELIARGDLRQEVKVQGNDELSDLARSFNQMTVNLRGILQQTQEAVAQITSAGNEILAASQQQASGAREQSAAVSETTSASKELSKSAEQVGESIRRVSDVTGHALAGMTKIKESIGKASEIISSLSEKSQKIGKITDVIDDVADQTNLLAVNAAIEAARAGEEGKGFTVVADEIRKLSDSTAKSTRDITALIEIIQHEISNVIMAMENSVNSVDEETRLSEEAAQRSKEIAMSANQQVSGSKQITEAMTNIDEVMKQIAASAQQSQVSVRQLTGLAQELKKTAEKFKLS